MHILYVAVWGLGLRGWGLGLRAESLGLRIFI